MTNSKKKPTEFYFIDMNDPGRYKKLKVLKACDFCRQRKSKCDIGVPGSGECSNCRKANIYCVFSPNKDSPDENQCFDNHNNRSSVNSLDLSVEQQEKEQEQEQERQQQQQQISGHFVQSHICLEPARNIPKKYHQSTALMHAIYNRFPTFEFDCINTTDRPQAVSTTNENTSQNNHNNKLSPPSLPPSLSSSVLLLLFSLSENDQLTSLLYQAYSRHIHPYFPLLHEPPTELSVYSALLAVLCYIRPPELLLYNSSDNVPLSLEAAEAYIHQAQALCLDRWSLGAAQTLLLLHKYQEITSTASSCKDYYLERVCIMFDNFFSLSNCHRQLQEVYSIQWLLYVSIALLPKQPQEQNIICKQWIEKCHYDDHCYLHYQQRSNISQTSPTHAVYPSNISSNNTIIMTNLKELIKLLKLYYTHVTQKARTESVSDSPSFSSDTDTQFQQAVVDWKLRLPKHLYNNTTTAAATAGSGGDSVNTTMEYNIYYSTCLLFLSDILLLLSVRSTKHGPKPYVEYQPPSLSESLATIARLQQCARTLVSAGYFMILGQSTILLALKLALNELICTYATWFAFSQEQELHDESSIIHWFGDWCTQSVWLCKHLNMDYTFFSDHLCEFRDALIGGSIMMAYCHQHQDYYYCYSFQKQRKQKQQKKQGEYHCYNKRELVKTYHTCSSCEPLSTSSLIPKCSMAADVTNSSNSNNCNGVSSHISSYRGSGDTEDESSQGEFTAAPAVNGGKKQVSDYFQNNTSACTHTTSIGLSLDDHFYQQVIIYYPVLDNNDSYYEHSAPNIYG